MKLIIAIMLILATVWSAGAGDSHIEYEETEICNVNPDNPDGLIQKMKPDGWEFLRKSKCSVLIQTDFMGGTGYTFYDSFIFRRVKKTFLTCWEYYELHGSWAEVEYGVLWQNIYGEKGWEAYGIDNGIHYFKRPIECKGGAE